MAIDEGRSVFPPSGRAAAIAALLLSVVLAPCARAEVDWRAGIAAGVTYDDNVTLAPDDEKEDFLFRVTPSVGLGLKRPRLAFDADYRLQYVFYDTYNQFDQTRWEDVQRANAHLNAGRWNGFGLDVLEMLERVSLDDRKPSSENNEAVNRSTRNTVRVEPSQIVDLTSFVSVEIRYQFEDVHYTKPEGDDRQSHRGWLILKDRLSEALGARLESSVRRVDSLREASATSNADSMDHQTRLGMIYDRSGGAYLDVSGGYARYKLDIGAWDGGMVWSALARIPWARPLKLELTADRDLSFGDIDGLRVTRSGEAALLAESQRLKGELRYRIYSDDYTASDRRLDAIVCSTAWTFAATPTLTASLRGAFTYKDLAPEDEQKELIDGSAALSYKSGFFGATARYAHQRENSTDDANDFRSNVISLDLSAEF